MVKCVEKREREKILGKNKIVDERKSFCMYKSVVGAAKPEVGEQLSVKRPNAHGAPAICPGPAPGNANVFCIFCYL